IFDSLLRVDDKFNWKPWLAVDLPQIEDDGKKWTFKLRSGVKFHDGQPLTSKDVRFTFEQIQHPKYQGVRASNFSRLKGVGDLRKLYSDLNTQVEEKKLTAAEADTKKLEAYEKWRKESGAVQNPDDTTVIFQLESAYAPMLATVAGAGILPEHLLGDLAGEKMKESDFARKPIGSGMYKFSDWKTQDKITLTVNKDWWGEVPNIETFVYRIFPDNNTAMAALEKGEIDYATIDPEQFPHFQNDVKNVKVFEYPTTSYNQLTLDLNNELFKDQKVRHALAYALDKETMVKQLLQGHGVAAWSHGTPSRWDYNPDVFKPVYDAAKAEQLLTEAGWVKGDDGVRVKDGKKFAFDLYFNSGEKVEAETAQVVQQQWKKIGVEVNLKGVDFPTLLDLSDAANPDRKQPPVYVLGWSLGSEPDAYSIWACDGSFNDIGYCNKRVDELLNSGRGEMNQEKRKQIYAEMQKILAEEQPYIWLWFPNSLDGMSARVKGPVNGTPAGIFWNFNKWWIDPGTK
ncbi:MAG TPA: peptide-binding protein, partial [Symbiobacteriaceae bacterium]|nr:peptide-binding protein [Symbiobacteriaceae bacterium]